MLFECETLCFERWLKSNAVSFFKDFRQSHIPNRFCDQNIHIFVQANCFPNQQPANNTTLQLRHERGIAGNSVLQSSDSVHRRVSHRYAKQFHVDQLTKRASSDHNLKTAWKFLLLYPRFNLPRQMKTIANWNDSFSTTLKQPENGSHRNICFAAGRERQLPTAKLVQKKRTKEIPKLSSPTSTT